MTRHAFRILAVLLSHWRRHPLQFVTLLIGLISATALWSGVQALNAHARDSYDRAARILGGARVPMLIPRDGATLPQSLYVDLRRAGWPVSPMVEGRVLIAGRSIRLIGIEPVTLPPATGDLADVGRDTLQTFVMPPGQTLADPQTLTDLGIAEGAQPVANGVAVPPIKASSNVAPGAMVVDIGVAQRVLHLPGQVSRLMIGEANGAPTPLEEIAGDRLIRREADNASDLERLTASFHLNLTAFGLLSFVVGIFIVNSAIGLAYEQRLPMLRTLRACGVSARALNTMLLIELVTLAMIAGIAGLVAGYGIASFLLPDVASSLRGLYGAQVAGQLSLRPQWWVAGLAMSAIGALAAAATSLARAARLPVLAAAQPQAWRMAQQRSLRIQGLLALGTAAVAAGCLWFGDSLITGFVVLAAILLAAALGLPVILGAVLAAGERSTRAALARWFWADNRQQLSDLSLALMALLLALAVNVGVGTMVESFSRTFLGWLDGRLAADVYVSAADAKQAQDIRDWLRDRPEVSVVLPTARADVQIGGGPVELFGLADHATYREQWPLLQASAGAWDRVRDGNAAFVSEQLARRTGLSIGDTIRVPTPAGEWPLRIAAIYADYGNPKGQLTVNVDALLRHFPDIPRTRFALRVDAGKTPALVDAMRERFKLDERSLADQASVKIESKRIFDRTFAVTSALNVFTLIVAGAALFTSLLTLSQSRLPQLAPLWAIGLDRRRLALIELTKTVSVAAITAILALPLGLLVAWCLIAIVNVKAFGWRLPFHVFPSQLIGVFVVALATAALASLLPVLKLARMQPAELIRVFSNER